MSIRDQALGPGLVGGAAAAAPSEDSVPLQCPSFRASSDAGSTGMCVHLGTPQSVHPAFQRVHCIGSLHTRCDVYRGEAQAPWTAADDGRIAALRRRALTTRLPLAAVSVAAVVAITVALVVGVVVGVGRDSSAPVAAEPSSEVAAPGSQVAPAAAEPSITLPPVARGQWRPAAIPAPETPDPAPATTTSATPAPVLSAPSVDELALLRLEGAPPPPAETPAETVVENPLLAWPDTIEHAIAPGDTLKALSTTFDTSVWAIVTLNEIDPERVLRIDQVLLIPVGYPSAPPSASAD